jgi:hypothetical protein
MTDDECVGYDEEIRDRGQCLASEALQPVSTATTVRVRNGKLSITDGPLAETKEHGFAARRVSVAAVHLRAQRAAHEADTGSEGRSEFSETIAEQNRSATNRRQR